MSLRVEDKSVQADQVGVLREEQVQVFQCLPQEEALHFVSWTWRLWITHVVDGRVATRGDLRDNESTLRRSVYHSRSMDTSIGTAWTDLGVFVEVLEDLKAPVLVHGVLGQPVQVEQTLHCFWTQEVVSVCKLHRKDQQDMSTIQCRHTPAHFKNVHHLVPWQEGRTRRQEDGWWVKTEDRR